MKKQVKKAANAKEFKKLSKIILYIDLVGGAIYLLFYKFTFLFLLFPFMYLYWLQLPFLLLYVPVVFVANFYFLYKVLRKKDVSPILKKTAIVVLVILAGITVYYAQLFFSLGSM